MTALSSLPWPSPEATTAPPVWTGDAFRLDHRSTRVLAFGGTPQGWSDDLTVLHEDKAGADHFIDMASRRHALAQLHKHLKDPEATILEVGCSSGHFLKELIQSMPKAAVIGADYPLPTLERLGAHLPHVPLLQFDLTRCPLPDATVDAVILLNVLEHIERDDLALQQVHRILKPNGIMILEVPAGPHLFDAYDDFLLHFRRYDMRTLEALTQKTGFRTLFKSHLGFFIYPAFWLAKKMNRRRGNLGEAERRRLVSSAIVKSGKTAGLASLLMSCEAWLRERCYLPLGIRCLITCVKS